MILTYKLTVDDSDPEQLSAISRVTDICTVDEISVKHEKNKPTKISDKAMISFVRKFIVETFCVGHGISMNDFRAYRNTAKEHNKARIADVYPADNFGQLCNDGTEYAIRVEPGKSFTNDAFMGIIYVQIGPIIRNDEKGTYTMRRYIKSFNIVKMDPRHTGTKSYLSLSFSEHNCNDTIEQIKFYEYIKKKFMIEIRNRGWDRNTYAKD